ncbi:MAG: hypothetical protein ACE15F_11725 [bacterium]
MSASHSHFIREIKRPRTAPPGDAPLIEKRLANVYLSGVRDHPWILAIWEPWRLSACCTGEPHGGDPEKWNPLTGQVVTIEEGCIPRRLTITRPCWNDPRRYGPSDYFESQEAAAGEIRKIKMGPEEDEWVFAE